MGERAPGKKHDGKRKLAVVDRPVSGSPNEARHGKLILIAGGERSVVDHARPLLLHLGETCRYTGGIGTAKVVKIVNNAMSMGNILIAAEAFALGVAAGVEPQTLYDVLSVSGGRSHHFTKRFPNALKGDFSPGFKMELGEKDLKDGAFSIRVLSRFWLANDKSGKCTAQHQLALFRALPCYLGAPAQQNFT